MRHCVPESGGVAVARSLAGRVSWAGVRWAGGHFKSLNLVWSSGSDAYMGGGTPLPPGLPGPGAVAPEAATQARWRPFFASRARESGPGGKYEAFEPPSLPLLPLLASFFPPRVGRGEEEEQEAAEADAENEREAEAEVGAWLDLAGLGWARLHWAAGPGLLLAVAFLFALHRQQKQQRRSGLLRERRTVGLLHQRFLLGGRLRNAG